MKYWPQFVGTGVMLCKRLVGSGTGRGGGRGKIVSMERIVVESEGPEG